METSTEAPDSPERFERFERFDKSEAIKASNPKKLVILDLDETLILSEDKEIPDHDYHFDSDNCKIWGKKRPHLELFLLELQKIADIGFWSASSRDYVDAILEAILPTEIKPIIILDIRSCSTKRYYNIGNISMTTKPLKKVWKTHKQYNRSNTIIIDDTPTTYAENYGNALPITKYNGSNDDKELLSLLEKLKGRLEKTDVRLGSK